MNVDFYTPTTFRSDDLQQKDRQYSDGIRYLLHAIMMGRIRDTRYRKGLRNGHVPIKAEFMRNVVGRHRWKPVRHLAIALDLVDCDQKYFPRRHAKGYRIQSPHDTAPWERRQCTDAGIGRRLTAWRRERQQAQRERILAGKTLVPPEVFEHLEASLRRVRVLDDVQLADFASEVAIAVDMIRRGRWFSTVDDYGRVHTNLTNLKREIRPYLQVDSEPLRNIDIANSQPLFIGIIAKRSGMQGKGGGGRDRGGGGRGLYVGQTDMPEVAFRADDLSQYLRLCEAGALYKFVHDRLPDGQDIAKTKQRVLTAFYDRDSHRNDVYRVLDESFPNLMAFLRYEKRDSYKQLAHIAQQEESRFMFRQVVPRLMRERPAMFVGTIHDSVLAPASEAEYVRDAMLAEFAQLGIKPTLRIERHPRNFLMQCE